MKQIMFYDKINNEKHGGILTDNGDIICGCCGGLIEKEDVDSDVEIIKVFEDWVELTDEICGDWI